MNAFTNLRSLLLMGIFLLVVSYAPTQQFLYAQSGTYSDSALLSWTPPTEREDGSALTDLDGYVIYYGLASGEYTESIEISAGLSSYMIEGLSDGTWFFAMTAKDSSGLESDYSNEVFKSIATLEPVVPSRPKAPGGLAVVD